MDMHADLAMRGGNSPRKIREIEWARLRGKDVFWLTGNHDRTIGDDGLCEELLLFSW